MKYPVPQQYIARVSQSFGVNYQNYARFGLLGHNGIDFAVPQGTPVFSLDDGTVTESQNDPSGYGLYVKVVHSWGESIYGHLSAQSVSRGASVIAGAQVGLSGNTGNSTGPHLHFGVRITPNFRDDGWGGYSDPQKFIDIIEKRMYWIGPHLAGPNVGDMVSEILRWKPSFVTYLDPSRENVRKIKPASPETKVIGRIYRPDSEVADRIKRDPIDAARWMDGIVRSHDAYGLCDYWQVANEVCQVDWSEYSNLCATMYEWQKLAHGSYKCAIFAFSVGNPDMPVDNRMAYWRRAIPALEYAIRDGNILLIHQYGARDLWGPDANWYINRYENQVYPRLGYLDKERIQASRDIVPTLKSLRVVSGEYGIDGLIYGEHKGWRDYTNPDDYARQLRSMASYVSRWPTVEGYCVYTCGHANDEWKNYDIWPEVAKRIADDAQSQQAPGSFVDVLKQRAAEAQCIQPNPDAALQKAMRTDGFALVGNEVYVTVGSTEFVAQKADSLSTGESRCYYVVVGDWSNVQWSKY